MQLEAICFKFFLTVLFGFILCSWLLVTHTVSVMDSVLYSEVEWSGLKSNQTLVDYFHKLYVTIDLASFAGWTDCRLNLCG